MREGVTGASLNLDTSRYFDIPHTHADTFDKVDPQELAACVAADGLRRRRHAAQALRLCTTKSSGIPRTWVIFTFSQEI
jgi:hypothetical protein